MKSTIVPAQITTVEDRIAGNLTFSQLLLMVAPVFFTGVVFTFIPPFMTLRGYKLIVCLSVMLICLTLAIRIKGRIVLVWISILGRYNLRPKYYLFNKNNLYLRDLQLEAKSPKVEQKKIVTQRKRPPLHIPTPQRVWAEAVAADPRAQLEFKTTKKGGLRVHIQEIK